MFNNLLISLLLLSSLIHVGLSDDSSTGISMSVITNPSTSTTNDNANSENDDSTTSTVSILTTNTQNSPSSTRETTTNDNIPTTTTNDGIIRWTFARTSQTTPSTRSTSRVSFTSTLPASKTTINQIDSSIFRLQFTIPEGDNYYNAPLALGPENDQNLELRLDLIQPHIWVMNHDDFINCNYLKSWLSSVESTLSETTSLPAAITTASQYTGNCDKYGLYVSATSNMPQPSDSNIENGDPYIIPYINQIMASGKWVTDDVLFNFTNGYTGKLSNFSFIDVNETNMFAGGLGLAGNPYGRGFLYNLVNQNIIKSPGYSLWFNNFTDSENAICELIPGVVNSKFYIGNLYSFDILPQRGYKFPASQQQANQELIELTLPIISLDDMKIENILTGQIVSIKSRTGGLPVLLNSRSIYSYLPLDVIVNLAIQTNAYYASEIGKWLVECDTLQNIDASVNFQMGNFSIKVPINEFIIDALYQDKILNFENGHKACYLTFIPTSGDGLNVLGLPFLRNIYLVVDNEGRKIAIAQSNKHINPEKEEEQESMTQFNQSSFSQVQYSSSTNNTADYSIDYIMAGNIPFATSNKYYNTDNLTLSYSSMSDNSGNSMILDIPARLTGAIIRSGSIYVSGFSGQPTPEDETTSDTNSTSSRGGARILNNKVEIGYVYVDLGLLSTLVSIIMVLIVLL
ncbi:unnamed protein product [Candida verbasci]|uniref:Peptidase A1 domain-containing protein n=1 Tax=Candida verbasci TaxID=1227364 RepID=A0A9W4XC89_9ASCO|nr:unnamed protein product [Candida verbasci]